MTILQNAYNAYLTKKYEKEINEFKELASTVIDTEVKGIEKSIVFEVTEVSTTDRLAFYKTTLEKLQKLKRDIKYNTLTVDANLYMELHIDNLFDEYKNLNNLIVEGESSQFSEIKFVGDIGLTSGIVINTHKHECICGNNTTNASQFAKDILNEIRMKRGLR